MIGKANRKLFMLRKLKKCVNVRPIVEYAAPVWHSSITLTQSYIIESIQKRVCRIILGNRYTHYDEVLSTLGLTSLHDDKRGSLCTKFAIKTYNSDSFSEWFLKTKSSHSMDLPRSNRVIEEYSFTSNRFRNSPVPYLTRLLNQI